MTVQGEVLVSQTVTTAVLLNLDPGYIAKPCFASQQFFKSVDDWLIPVSSSPKFGANAILTEKYIARSHFIHFVGIYFGTNCCLSVKIMLIGIVENFRHNLKHSRTPAMDKIFSAPKMHALVLFLWFFLRRFRLLWSEASTNSNKVLGFCRKSSTYDVTFNFRAERPPLESCGRPWIFFNYFDFLVAKVPGDYTLFQTKWHVCSLSASGGIALFN